MKKRFFCPECHGKAVVAFAGNSSRKWRRIKGLWQAVGGGDKYQVKLQCKRDTCRKLYEFSGRRKSDVMCSVHNKMGRSIGS
jgi:hypothetical protein